MHDCPYFTQQFTHILLIHLGVNLYLLWICWWFLSSFFSIWALILPTLLSLKSIIMEWIFHSFKESCCLVFHISCISALEFVYLGVVCGGRSSYSYSDIQFHKTRWSELQASSQLFLVSITSICSWGREAMYRYSNQCQQNMTIFHLWVSDFWLTQLP